MIDLIKSALWGKGVGGDSGRNNENPSKNIFLPERFSWESTFLRKNRLIGNSQVDFHHYEIQYVKLGKKATRWNKEVDTNTLNFQRITPIIRQILRIADKFIANKKDNPIRTTTKPKIKSRIKTLTKGKLLNRQTFEFHHSPSYLDNCRASTSRRQRDSSRKSWKFKQSFNKEEKKNHNTFIY